ncbi:MULTISPECIES: DnaT-like ssDNA-binding domain-containing protein [Nocardia]|uniref:DnaT-like ssDNA-binding domain-containing protein n=1 Tax=Nocardia TaxID=1817 RepID=UPI00130097A4
MCPIAITSRHSRDILARSPRLEQGNRGTEEKEERGAAQAPPAPSSRTATPKPPTAKRGTAIPADWIPTEQERQRLAEQHPTIDLRAEHEKFVDYWLSKGEARKDWSAAFRNWLRKATEFTPSRPGPRQSPSQPPNGLTPAEMKFARAKP